MTLELQQAMNTLQTLKTQKLNEIAAIDVAITVLNKDFEPRLEALEEKTTENDALKVENETLKKGAEVNTDVAADVEIIPPKI